MPRQGQPPLGFFIGCEMKQTCPRSSIRRKSARPILPRAFSVRSRKSSTLRQKEAIAGTASFAFRGCSRPIPPSSDSAFARIFTPAWSRRAGTYGMFRPTRPCSLSVSRIPDRASIRAFQPSSGPVCSPKPSAAPAALRFTSFLAAHSYFSVPSFLRFMPLCGADGLHAGDVRPGAVSECARDAASSQAIRTSCVCWVPRSHLTVFPPFRRPGSPEATTVRVGAAGIRAILDTIPAMKG